MATGGISTDLPNIKRTAVEALTANYQSESQALTAIAGTLRSKYAGAVDLSRSIEGVQKVYRDNFFPEMKADWRAYPNNLGHKDWPGCFRCHDEKHATADGGAKIRASDCSTCHTLLAQGRGEELQQLAPRGLEFKHPGGDLDPELLCSDCHNGGIQGK
jgi:hypothetical protein